MKKRVCLILSLMVAFCIPAVGSDNRVKTYLWPKIKPLHSGYLRVSEIHQIYYEVSGNPRGKPIFFLHGGPGDSSTPRMRRWANPKQFMIILHDQRGAGQSLPSGEILENTTQDLVADIERLRKHLGLNRIILVGASWGTTLALTYAETYPQNIAAMVLRGVFTATKSEIDHIFHGGVAPFFPKVYQDFLNSLPNPDTLPLPPYLFHLLHAGDKKTRLKVAQAWGKYTIQISMLEVSEDMVNGYLNSYDPFVNAYFENYYMSHGAFLEEGEILRDIHKIAHIPTVIINGRYDLICPLRTAYKLHKALPKSILVVVEGAGHSEQPIEKALIKAIRSVLVLNSFKKEPVGGVEPN